MLSFCPTSAICPFGLSLGLWLLTHSHLYLTFFSPLSISWLLTLDKILLFLHPPLSIIPNAMHLWWKLSVLLHSERPGALTCDQIGRLSLQACSLASNLILQMLASLYLWFNLVTFLCWITIMVYGFVFDIKMFYSFSIMHWFLSVFLAAC